MDERSCVALGIESFRPVSSLVDPGSQQTNFGGREPLALERHHQAWLEPTDQADHETLRALPRLEGGPRDSSPGCHRLHIPAQLILLLTRPVAGVTLAGQKGTKDRKSTRLNSSHTVISYAVFCLK